VNGKIQVFLSHATADKPSVEELAIVLQKRGIEPRLDRWHLVPGNPWQEAIEKALGECAACAVFIGPSAIGPWQNAEMRAAIERRVSDKTHRFRVIPVLLPGAERPQRSSLPMFLVATTWVEFHKSLDDEDALHRLECGIRGIPPGPGPGQALYEGQCPYRGLEFFDVAHAPYFFGREKLTARLVEKLGPNPLAHRHCLCSRQYRGDGSAARFRRNVGNSVGKWGYGSSGIRIERQKGARQDRVPRCQRMDSQAGTACRSGPSTAGRPCPTCRRSNPNRRHRSKEDDVHRFQARQTLIA
jgi:hypothetical protein